MAHLPRAVVPTVWLAAPTLDRYHRKSAACLLVCSCARTDGTRFIDRTGVKPERGHQSSAANCRRAFAHWHVMDAIVLEPSNGAWPDGLPSLFDEFRVIDRNGVARWAVLVCPCGGWQLETDDNPHWASPIVANTEAAVLAHRSECGVLDVLAGLAGIQP